MVENNIFCILYTFQHNTYSAYFAFKPSYVHLTPVPVPPKLEGSTLLFMLATSMLPNYGAMC